MTQVVLGLGSNRGDTQRDSSRIVLDAIAELGKFLTELRSASLYVTDPLYVTDQARFINTVVCGYYPDLNTRASSDIQTARELLYCIHYIESRFGRDRVHERRWGERLLDIDILLFGDLVLNESDLIIPHPRLNERRFALEPLLELLPDAAEPGTGLSYRSICEALPDQGVRLLLSTQ